MKKRNILCVLALVFFSPLPAWGTTYYVAKTGSDANSCATAQTIGTPRLTITAGLACLTGGDTLLIRTGTYAERITQANVPSGTSWGVATTISAYNGEVVTMRPASSTAPVVYFLYGSTVIQYIIFSGLIFDGNNIADYNVSLDGYSWGPNVQYIRFLNCEFKNSLRSGVLTGRGADHLEFIGGSSHNNGTDVQLDHGLYFQSSYVQVEKMDLYSNAASGAQFYNGFAGHPNNNNTIRFCKVHDNAFGIIIGSGDNGLAHNNLIYSQHVNGHPGSGYGLAAYSGAGTNGCTNIKIYNNTVYGNAGDGIENRSGCGSTTIRNNISTANGGGNIVVSGTGFVPATSDHNLTADPGFIAPGSGNFGLLATATTAIDQGFDLGGGFLFNGTAPDIGAHETITFSSGKVPDSVSDNTR